MAVSDNSRYESRSKIFGTRTRDLTQKLLSENLYALKDDESVNAQAILKAYRQLTEGFTPETVLHASQELAGTVRDLVFKLIGDQSVLSLIMNTDRDNSLRVSREASEYNLYALYRTHNNEGFTHGLNLDLTVFNENNERVIYSVNWMEVIGLPIANRFDYKRSMRFNGEYIDQDKFVTDGELMVALLTPEEDILGRV